MCSGIQNASEKQQSPISEDWTLVLFAHMIAEAPK